MTPVANDNKAVDLPQKYLSFNPKKSFDQELELKLLPIQLNGMIPCIGIRYLMAPKSRFLTTIKLVRKDSLLIFTSWLCFHLFGGILGESRTRVNTNADGV